MIWKRFERVKKDIYTIIQENPEKYPLYDFLSFLMAQGDDGELVVTVYANDRKQKIESIYFCFEDESPLLFKMGELPIFDYDWFLKEPGMLMEHFQQDIRLTEARSIYDKCEQQLEMVENLRTHHRISKNFDVLWAIEERLEYNLEYAKQRQEAIEDGALFVERLTERYQAYLEKKERPEPIPAPETSMPVTDIIEVELLTILDDPDISDATKIDAKETLEIYQQEQTAIKQTLKEESARIAIETIKKHYVKGGAVNEVVC